jgi:hypothetical protein
MKKNIWQYIGVFAALICAIALGVILSNPAKAQSPSSIPTSAQVGTCEGDAQGLVSFPSKPIPAGDIYAKLNVPGSHQDIRVYAQALDGSACNLLGKANANAATWVAIGKLDAKLAQQPLSFVVYGTPTSSNPYQTVASLLVVTDANLCKPAKDCTVSYAGQESTLQPQKLSASSDPIGVDVASPPAGAYTSVDYYVDNHFVYSSPQLETVNFSYLGGGVHIINRVANFPNGEKLTFTQTLDMGIDANGNLYIKSWFYRQKGSIQVLLIAGGVVLAMVVFVGLLRLIHRRRLYRSEHGFDNLKSK